MEQLRLKELTNQRVVNIAVNFSRQLLLVESLSKDMARLAVNLMDLGRFRGASILLL